MLYEWNSIALVFPLEFRDFFAFIILEIRKQHKKEIVRNVSECILENSRERKKNSMLYKWDSIALVFPLEFRDFLHSLFWKYENRLKKL